MELSSPITIKLASFKDNNNNLIKPDPLVLSKLTLIFIDDPENEMYQCQIMEFGGDG